VAGGSTGRGAALRAVEALTILSVVPHLRPATDAGRRNFSEVSVPGGAAEGDHFVQVIECFDGSTLQATQSPPISGVVGE
jgi:hypothetical protein